MNLLERRRTMSQSKSVNKTYTPVNYIRANWNEYIDTGIYPNMSTEIDIIFMPHSTSYTNFVISSRYGWKDKDVTIRNTGVASFFDSECTSSTVTSVDTKYHAIFGNIFHNETSPIWIRKNITITDLGTNTVVRNVDLWNSSTDVFETIYTFYLFGCNNAGTASFLSSMNLYSAIIKNEGVVVFDGIPVLDADGTPCVYDRVSDNFFYGQRGVGFTYG